MSNRGNTGIQSIKMPVDVTILTLVHSESKVHICKCLDFGYSYIYFLGLVTSG